jgi:small-conductance mechanosensitive channel/CRP-like cAMP-binding protein
MLQLATGIVLLLATLAIRGASANRYIRRKLLVSAWMFAAYAAGAALVAYAGLTPEVVRQLGLFLPLLFVFAIVNALVVLAINPWRIDRIPDQFPNIVQDALIIALFALAATLFLQERVLATTAVGAVILGFALQDTLGNLFAGLAIQIEKPFRVGHWVTIGGESGLVSEITWRATKIRTKAGNFVIVPNSVLARESITNYSEPTLETRVEVEVGAGYETPPNEVKAAIRKALRDEPLIVRTREPEVLLVDFGGSAIMYRVRVWTTDFAADERVRDRIRSQVYYAFRRSGINIPYPIQVQIEQPVAMPAERGPRTAAIDEVEIFAPLSAEQRLELADAARPALYAEGEVIVREGDHGSSMFIVKSGEASLRLAAGGDEIAQFRHGDFFGEMSLLTGDPRTATVTAASDCELLEIGADAFRRVVLADPAVVERISAAVSARRSDLETHRTMKAAPAAPIEPPHSFLARVRHFLRLS